MFIASGMVDYTPPLNFDDVRLSLPPDLIEALTYRVKVGACDTLKLPGGESLTLTTEGTEGGGFGRSNPITIGQACEVLGITMARHVTDLQRKLRQLGTFRAFITSRGVHTSGPRNLARAVAELAQHSWPQRRNPLHGPTIISTRNLKWIGKEDGQHCGQNAKHYRRGRPALSAGEVLRRQLAHNARRRKTTRPYVMKKRKPYKVPETMYGRPMTREGLRVHDEANPPERPRKAAVIQGLRFMSNREPWQVLQRRMIKQYIEPLVEKKEKEWLAIARDWLDACCMDLAAHWMKLIPPNAQELLGLPSAALGAQWPED